MVVVLGVSKKKISLPRGMDYVLPPNPLTLGEVIMDLNNQFIEACERGDLKAMEELRKAGADPRAFDDVALRKAAKSNQLYAVIRLIDLGARADAKDNMAMRLTTSMEIVMYLATHGGDIHTWDEHVLRYAARNGNLDLVKYAVKNHADTHAMEDEALRWAKIMEQEDVIEYLENLP